MNKIEQLKKSFACISTKEELYQKIMAKKQELPSFNEEWKIESNRVTGCQSIMYLHSYFEAGNLFFYAFSDALISSGLAAILIEVYSGEPPETILITPPNFLEELGIVSALTPGRANGLASLYLKMKQAAVPYLLSYRA